MKMMNRLLKTFAVLVFLAALAPHTQLRAQRVAIKTNALYWAAGGTINFAGELAVDCKTTVELGLTGNPWYLGKKSLNRKLWHWTVQPEVRFWHVETFNRGFLGVHLTAGAFDAGGIKLPLGILPGLGTHRYEGWMAGIGASYGWQWYLTPHLNLEATFGFGYLYMKYNRFGCETCTPMDQKGAVKHYFGPTKIGVSLVYLFRSKK